MSVNVRTAKAAYEAFRSGDMETLAAMFADDAEWVTSDELPLGGTTRGRDAIIGNFKQIPDYWSSTTSSPRSSSTRATGLRSGGHSGPPVRAGASSPDLPT